jgi:hypothetical protein
MTTREQFERAPEHDKRFARGDHYAADAWLDHDSGDVIFVAVGFNPNTDAP